MLDPDGADFADLDALRKSVLEAARDVMCGDMRNGILDFRFRIDAEDGDGSIAYSLPFKHAVSIIGEGEVLYTAAGFGDLKL